MGGHDPHLAARLVHLAFDGLVDGGQVGAEPLQVGDAARFGRPRLIQEGIEGIRRLAAQPGHEALAHGQVAGVAPVQQPGVKVERRADPGLGAEPADQDARCGPFRPFFGPVPEGPPQGTGPTLGQIEHAVFPDIAKRTAQQTGQGQVILGIEGGAAEGQQVLEHRMFGQFQPVGAGDRDA